MTFCHGEFKDLKYFYSKAGIGLYFVINDVKKKKSENISRWVKKMQITCWWQVSDQFTFCLNSKTFTNIWIKKYTSVLIFRWFSVSREFSVCPRFSDSLLTFESNSVIAQVQLWVFSVTKATRFLLWYIFMLTYAADLTCSYFCYCSFIFFCKISCTACPRFWLVRSRLERPWFDVSSS